MNHKPKYKQKNYKTEDNKEYIFMELVKSS